MFKKTLLLLILGAVGLGYGTRVNAETIIVEDKRPLLERAKEWKVERRNRVKAELNRIRERFPAAFERIERLIIKIEERIIKFEEKQLETTLAKMKIAEAKTLLAEAKTLYEELKGKIELASTQLTGEQSKPLAIIEEVRHSIKNLVEKIKLAHEKVREAVKALKEARMETEINSQTN